MDHNLMKHAWIMLCMAITVLSCDKTPDKVQENEITELPFHEMDLSDLTSFSKAENWKVAGNVHMNRQEDNQATIENGQGVLVSEAAKKATMITGWGHQDCDLKLDFMLSKGASLSLLFQERYRINFKDDWGNQNTPSEFGTIQQADNSLERPSQNTCKAPGLWQHLSVRFKAARYDKDGNKLHDAMFEEISLNGWPIHRQVTMAGYPEDEDAAKPEKASLLLVSDTGPVAVKKIQYKPYTNERIGLTGMGYEVFSGLYKNYDTLKTFTPIRSGKADSLHWKLGEERTQLVVSGKMSIPVAGDYLFRIRAGGPAWLVIDNKEIVDNHFTRDYGRTFSKIVTLTKGEHPFQMIYANYDESLVIEYEGPDIPLTALTSLTSERTVRPAPPMEYVLAGEPGIQRGFFTHHGRVNTYAISIGIPGGLNFAYDLSTGNILTAWHGRFIDVSNMWHERGESQMQLPLASTLEFSGVPPLLMLKNKEDVWTDTVEVDNNMYTNRQYRLDENGLPVFLYSYQDVRVEDQFQPLSDRSGLKRKVTATFTKPAADLYFMLGRGVVVETPRPDVYSIDNKEYYIESFNGSGSMQPEIVHSKDGYDELLISVSGKAGEPVSFEYSIIW